ncbi:MAG: NFACT family protein [Candidatus Diapherotrites archaeon]
MQLINLSLAFLVEELRPFLEGSFVNKVQELDKDKFKFKLHSRQGAKNLIVTPEIFFLSEFKLDAKKLTSGFGAFLRKRLEGKKIISVKQKEFDRVAELEFDSFYLVIELFAKGNIILTDKNYLIDGALKKEEWKDRKIEKGLQYKFPQSSKLNPQSVSFKEFMGEAAKYEKTLVYFLMERFKIAPIVAEEIIFQCSQDKKMAPSKLSEKESKKVFEAMHSIHSIELKKLKPVKAVKEKEEFLLPFPFRSIAGQIELSQGLNGFLDEYFAPKILGTEEKNELKESAEESHKIKALEYSLNNQLSALKGLESEAEQNKLKAELIYLNESILKNLLSIIAAATTTSPIALADSENQKQLMYKLNLFLQSNAPELKVVELTKNKLVLEKKD